jgi:DnaJ like chaperone protein
MNSWLGKFIGAVSGYIAFGGYGHPFLGLMLGLWIGSWFDKALSGALPGAAGNAGATRVRQAFFNSAFSVMGHVCKADGHVSEKEIRTAERLIAQMGLNPEQRARAIAEFNRGKNADFNLETEISGLRRLCQFRRDLLNMFLEIQIQAAMADGPISATERSLLLRIGMMLGLGALEFARLEAILNMGRGAHRSQTGKSNASDRLGEAYRLLGVPATATESEIKKAYRRQMGKHHPDKLAARGLPPEMAKMATQETMKIRGAYDAIREARGFG